MSLRFSFLLITSRCSAGEDEMYMSILGFRSEPCETHRLNERTHKTTKAAMVNASYVLRTSSK